jgi:DNA repair exonuclease SbcCD ATPase subunit
MTTKNDEPLTDEELRALVEKAHRYTTELCRRERDWRMSVPPRPDVLSSALDEQARRIRELEAEVERLQDECANTEHAMLTRFDPDAAGSTDLYTWIKCKIAEVDRLRERCERLEAKRTKRADLEGTMQPGGFEYFSKQRDEAERRARAATSMAEEAQAEAAALRQRCERLEKVGDPAWKTLQALANLCATVGVEAESGIVRPPIAVGAVARVRAESDGLRAALAGEENDG